MLQFVPGALTSLYLAGQVAGGVALVQAAKKNHPGNAILQQCADLLLSGRVWVRVMVGHVRLGLWPVMLQSNYPTLLLVMLRVRVRGLRRVWIPQLITL